ncbi:methyltransferase-like protein 25 [Pecten maximus]|uniref:methyltransferase-like protein 25 n=1 Tax=Pecten maximus TaxID=6579 RepID=UPI00145902DD|nr:methyltransferase-like protein 25 [Pecten maximus]XP_033739674.1 methyltransferase-like protein 25 [Pecten maximus]XP_033739675.1 methyltransferase-like protein 25 [Pecten maximus]
MSESDETTRHMDRCGNPAGLNLKKVQLCLDDVLHMLQSYLPFCNAHSNDFIIHNHWENHIPAEIREELLAMSDQQLCDFPAKYIDMVEKNVSCDSKIAEPIADEWIHQDLKSYLQAACDTNLQSLGVLVDIEYLFSKSGLVKDVLQIKNFMTDKKSHEVDIMTCVCSRLASTMGSDVIVDMGSGKGYLSTQLALKCHKTVVGIDAQMINTKGAIKRAKILTKQWKGLVRNAQELHDTGAITKKSKKLKKKLKKERMSVMMAEEGNTEVSMVEGAVREEFDGLGMMFGDEEDATLVVSSELTKDPIQEHGELNWMGIDRQSRPSVTLKTPPGTLYRTDMSSEILPQSERNTSPKFEIENFDDLTLVEKATQDVNTCSPQNNGHSTSNKKEQKYSSEVNVKLGIHVEKEILHTDSKDIRKKQQKNSDKAIKPEADLPYIPVTLFVDTSMDLMEVVSEALADYPSSTGRPGHKQEETTLMLTGLHTCGALGSSMLELFVNNPTVKVLCGVGCCYHYMRETFDPDCQECEEDFPVGFPMSRYLKDQEVYIGRKARNFASQSIYRQAQDTELSFATYPRCLLQKILLDTVGHIDPDWKGLRGLGGMTPDMYKYVVKAFTKLGLPTDKITPELVADYCERYHGEKRKLAAFRQLKSVLAPTIEAMVLLDRACYLLEQECVGEVYMVQMFDPVISPRCYGIVAIKKS